MALPAARPAETPACHLVAVQASTELALGGALSGTFSLLRKPVDATALSDRVSALLEAGKVAARKGGRRTPDHLVHEPFAARPWPTPLRLDREQPAEAQAPLATGFVAHHDPTSGKDQPASGRLRLNEGTPTLHAG